MVANNGNGNNWKRDALGEIRRVARYRHLPETVTAIRTETQQGGKGYINPPSYAKKRDEKAFAKMRLDEVVALAIGLRRNLVAGTSWYLEAGDDESKPLVAVIEALIKRIPNFEEALYKQTLAIFEGVSFLRMTTANTNRNFKITGDSLPRLWWFPQLSHVGADFIGRDVEYVKESFADGTDSQRPVYSWSTFDVVADEWLRIENPNHYIRWEYHSDAYSLNYGHSLMDAVYLAWQNKKHLEKQMLQGAKRFAFPWVGIELTPEQMQGGADDESHLTPEQMVARWASAYQSMTAGDLICYGTGSKIVPVAFSGEGATGLLRLIEYYNDKIKELILGASMPTGGGGDNGSLARAAVEAGSTSRLIAQDRQMLESCMQTLIAALVKYNLKNLQQIIDPNTGQSLDTMTPPRFRIGREETDDYGQNITNASAAAQLVPLKLAEVYKKTGFTQPSDEELANGETVGGMPPPVDPMMAQAGVGDPMAPGAVPQLGNDQMPLKAGGQPDVSGDVDAYRLSEREFVRRLARRFREREVAA